jgi:acetylornithine deacetylase
MIERLIAFDTTSAFSNLELIAFVEDYLAGWGAACRKTFDATGAKANLFATLGDPTAAGGVVLSGHSDVVPVTGQSWASDPFQASERDGRLYGRGAADMKSFLAIALAMVPDMVEAGLARPIHFALSYDEEVGCIGVQGLIDDIVANLARPRAVIVGEPTEMKPVVGHKGIVGWNVSVHGKAAHSSQPQLGANAIVAAAKLIGELDAIAEDLKAEAPGDSPFSPPYTTIGVGTIEGGEATNIVANHCEFKWEFRPIPGQDEDAIIGRFERCARDVVEPWLRQGDPEARIDIVERVRVTPLSPEEDGSAESLVRQLTGSNERGFAAFTTEGGLFQSAGMSTVICGPGSILQAHKADEYIELSQIAACEDFLRKLIGWAAE